MQLTYTELVKLASTETTYEKQLKDYMTENGEDDPDAEDFEFHPDNADGDCGDAYDRGEDDGSILTARKVCNMLGLSYALPVGFKDSLYP
jgi:hypothetical protein